MATKPKPEPDYVPAVCGLCDKTRLDPTVRSCTRIGCPLQRLRTPGNDFAPPPTPKSLWGRGMLRREQRARSRDVAGRKRNRAPPAATQAGKLFAPTVPFCLTCGTAGPIVLLFNRRENMGLHVSVLRANGRDCTNGGISARASELCLVNVAGPFAPSPEIPAAVLVEHCPHDSDIGRRLVRIVPAVQVDGEWQADKRWMMFGGNYAGCSDSRFREAVEEALGTFFYGAVAIHDRYEA